MDNGGGLDVQPLVAQGGFNWVFLVSILVCGILAVFFLFYFNRLFATIVAYAIRAWTWHKYRAYIDISSLQISLLGGRVFFKSIRYHAHNVTVFVYEGHVTWRYWLRLVQDAEVFLDASPDHKGKNRSSSIGDDGKSSSDEKAKSRSRSIGKEESAGGKPKKELPCRISVKVGGVEAFVYNRSPVYDFVMENTKKHTKAAPSSSGSNEKTATGLSSSSNETKEKTNSFGVAAERTQTGLSTVAQTSSQDSPDVTKLPAFLRMFPIRIECKKAAAAVGNENTTSVIAAKLEKAAGTIDAGHAGPLDWYKLLFNFDLENINVTMKPNRDFKSLQLEAARRIIREREAEKPLPKTLDFQTSRNMRKRWHSFTGMLTRSKSVNGSLRTASMVPSVDGSAAKQDQLPGQTQWHGLARYLDDTDLNEHDEWRDVEYAKASTLADIDKLHFRFYFDMPGTVPETILDQASSEFVDDMNGSKPPDYGMEFYVHGGVVTYGPWADRQRLNLQQVFFPATYVDSVPTPALKPGETRNWSLFKIFILIEKDVTLRIPSKEPSKDDKWQGRAEKNKPSDGVEQEDAKRKGKHGRKHRHHRNRKAKTGGTRIDARPYGWLDVTVKTDSTVSYVMDMFPKADGYRNSLDVDVKNTEITSSVNHGLLWRTGAVSVQADLSQPVTWNSVRKWPFDIQIDDMELFILRDHLFLIIDLVNDWSSGAPSDFYTFVPYIYSLRMLFRNFIMYLNVNDANIVNDAAELDKNDFLTLEGLLDSTLDISMEEYRPVRNMITFDVLAKDLRMRMLSPARSTINAFLKDKVVAELPKLTLKGSYSGHIEERVGLTDTLRFDIIGTGLSLKAYGFLVRQLINVKENYFGDYLHFKTLEEFQDADEDLVVANLKTASLPKPTTINELDVILCIIAEDATIMFPTNLYSCDEFVRAELPVANLDLRILSYYLDMGLQLSPLTFISGTSASGDESPVDSASNTQMFVKHVDLDGHRAFGLPPNEPAYANQWDIDVGAITGEFSASFIHDLAMGARAFIFGFADRENALPLPSPSVFDDVTFVQVRTDTVRLWFHIGKDAMLFSADPIEVVTNDLAGNTFSQRVSVLAPKVTLACVDGRSASRHRVREATPGAERTRVRTYAFLQTGASVTVVMRKLHFEEERRKQQAHIRESDRRTNRVPFLLRNQGRVSAIDDGEDFEPPAMPYPPLPLPLVRDGVATPRPASVKSVQSFLSGRNLKAKTSSSSLSTSIKAAAPAANPNIQRFRREDDNLTPSSRSMRSNSSVSSAESANKWRIRSSDRARASFGLPPTTVAFSSPFSEPYFPLDTVEPDETNVPEFDSIPAKDDAASDHSSISGTIDNPDADQDAAQTSVLIKVVPGIRAYVEPRIVATAAKIIRKISPKEPDEIMDAYQTDALGAVAAEQEQHHGTNQTLDIEVGLPAAKFRVLNPTPKEQPDDQLEIGFRSIETLVRVKQLPLDQAAPEVLAVHATVTSFAASLGQSKSTPDAAAVQANLEDILVWVAVARNRSVHAALGDAVFSVSAEQAAYLTDLALRLVPLINELKDKVVKSLTTPQQRLWLLIRTLITNNTEDMADPIFLARMTYILRAFPDHFRNQDSWKILVRFRHILQSLPPKVVDDLKASIRNGDLDSISEAPVRKLDDWAQWRNWDVPNVHQTVALKLLMKDDKESMHVPDAKPLTLTVRSDYIRVAVDAGEQSNEILLEETTIGLDSTPPTMPTGLMLMDENTRTKTVAQMHTSSIAVSANWSIFGIVEMVLPLQPRIDELTSQAAQSGQPSAAQRFEETLTRHVFQVIASTDNGSISLETINLRHISRSDGLKISVIGTTYAGEQDGFHYGPCTTAIINADEATTELHSHSRCLLQTQLTSPSIYVDYVQPLQSTNVPPSTTIAVGYKDLRISLTEQVPGLLRVADSVVLDEVTRVMKLIESTKSTSPQQKVEVPKSVAAASGPPIKVHFALLAGELILEVSLLQSLKYQLQGTAASVRVAPNLTQSNAWGIDFDVGRQLHCFVNSSENKRSEQDILDVPPINGHVGLAMQSASTSLSVAATMDRIDVDAAAIQGVVAVLSQPEVQNVISAIKTGIQEVQHHAETVKPAAALIETNQVGDTKQLAFDVRFALLGVRVAAVTPYGLKSSATAEAEFGVGPIHAIASNRAALAENKILLPEVRAEIRDIGAKLQIHERHGIRPCGNATFGLSLQFKSRINTKGQLIRELKVSSRELHVNAYPDTAPTAVDVINHLQDRIRDLDLSKEMEYLRRLSDNRRGTVIQKISGKQASDAEDELAAFSPVDLLSLTTTIELRNIRVAWLVDEKYATIARSRVADLVLSLERIEFTTRGGHEARLVIQDTQLQFAKRNAALNKRSVNSALMPEVTFSVGYWSEGKSRRLAFKAAGQPLEIRLESKFMYPVNAVQRSIESAIEKFKVGTATWKSTPTASGAPRAQMFDTKRIASLLMEADFGGIDLFVQGSGVRDHNLATLAATSQQHGAQHGRYGQFAADGAKMQTSLRAPGIAMKIEYNAHTDTRQPTVNGEVSIEASSNMLLPNVVPLLLEVSNSVKEVMQNQDKAEEKKHTPPAETKPTQKFFEDESIVSANPTAFFGKTKVDLGLRVCRQEFGLTCQPIARVDAKAAMEDFYITMNTIDSEEHGHFFALSAMITKLTAEVKHVYSREPTFTYDMDSIVFSVLNSKHLSGTSGISAILKINPTHTFINGKQFQDLLLFREIWLPPEIRKSQRSSSPEPVQSPSRQPDEYFVAKYRSVAAAAAFPWNATVSIAELAVDLDLGQSIGKSSFTINNLWASQAKSSGSEQNLCVGMDEMAMNSTGRMSGFIRLSKMGVRTSITWPQDTVQHHKTPLIQASVGFQRLLAKAAFDYQAFAFGDIEGFDFLMYNVHQGNRGARDRLVAVLDCEKAYVFCTSTSPAQAVSLYQAFDRLIQEKQAAYMQSLTDIEKHLRRESTVVPTRFGPQIPNSPIIERQRNKMGISLHTDVVLTMGTISFGVFPSTFFDSQILKLEANNIQGRFAVGLEKHRIQSGLGITLGQLQVALASVRKVTTVPKALDISVDDVVSSAVNARGGTILRVPKVVASMQTWQAPESNNVDYIFKSLFDGKIDVGWNLSRIEFIKNMWMAHSRSLASRLGKALPESAVKITASNTSASVSDIDNKDEPREKITAEVNLPQSRYEYNALEPPVIETPQLRDLGDATPPLEWIGLHRDRLPNVTHQILIVSLLEVAREVEDAYEKILGSS